MIISLLRGTSLIYSIVRDSHKTIRCIPKLHNRNLNSDSAAYDGDGKTTVKLLGQDENHIHFVSTYSSKGFRLANNLFIAGSILLFPTQVFSWNVRRGIDINSESLLLFDLLVPKVKIVVIGYGQHGEPYDAKLIGELRRKGISCELLPTPHAVSTYNYLVHDSVHVAGAFIPVKDDVKMTHRDEVLLAHGSPVGENIWQTPYREMQAERLARIEERDKKVKDKTSFDG